jgi:Cu+-exporting ATPase
MITWYLLLNFEYVTVPRCNICWAIERGISVLVASCPCALGLAVPSVVAIVLNIAIKNGILIKNIGVFEKMKKCKIISFDKTGTLFTRINKIEEYHMFREDIP